VQSSGRFLAPAVAASTQAAVAVILVYAEIAIIGAAGYGSYVVGKLNHTWVKSWRVVQDPSKPTPPTTSALNPTQATIVGTANEIADADFVPA
jgi:hypothetical protein